MWIKKSTWDQHDGSEDKGTFQETWHTEFNPWTHLEEEENTSCLNSTHMPLQVSTYPHPVPSPTPSHQPSTSHSRASRGGKERLKTSQKGKQS